MGGANAPPSFFAADLRRQPQIGKQESDLNLEARLVRLLFALVRTTDCSFICVHLRRKNELLELLPERLHLLLQLPDFPPQLRNLALQTLDTIVARKLLVC